MLHPTGLCPTHGYQLVSMPRDPEEPHVHEVGVDGLGAAIMRPIPGTRDDKGYTFKCPLTSCLAGIPRGNG